METMGSFKIDGFWKILDEQLLLRTLNFENDNKLRASMKVKGGGPPYCHNRLRCKSEYCSLLTTDFEYVL